MWGRNSGQMPDQAGLVVTLLLPLVVMIIAVWFMEQ